MGQFTQFLYKVMNNKERKRKRREREERWKREEEVNR